VLTMDPMRHGLQLAGPSMLPTFNEAGDIVVVDCLFVKMGRELKKGDIVISKSPTNPRTTVCKRVLGLVSPSVCYPHDTAAGLQWRRTDRSDGGACVLHSRAIGLWWSHSIGINRSGSWRCVPRASFRRMSSPEEGD
jgi:hypothetical protein